MEIDRTIVTSNLQDIVDSGLLFGCVYADPPWQYNNHGTRSSAKSVYQTMPVDDICNLPIDSCVAEESQLHLWTTNSFLFEAQTIMKAWGFDYKSCAVWCKPQMGIGNYWRVSHEFLLLGVRGRCPFQKKNLRSWHVSDRLVHSRKPHVFREMIEKASPKPRLELFARQMSPGWSAWGNEIEPCLFDDRLTDLKTCRNT